MPRPWPPRARANTALEIYQMAEAIGLPLAAVVAEHAWRTAAQVLAGGAIELEIAIFDRQGRLAGRTPFGPVSTVAERRNRRS